MTFRKICLCLLLLLGATCAAKTPAPADLVVHEWGTFLAMNDSDGVTLDGMYHEEHALPAFVHARGRDQLRLRSALIKGETPVIYFYTKERQKVQVRVGFPRGVWTQWYPQAGFVGPALAASGSPPALRDGRITWFAEILPAGTGVAPPALPSTRTDALWNFARDVDAAFVRASNPMSETDKGETERFLFYRGLGQATMPLEMDAAGGGTLTLSAALPEGVRHLFVLRVEKNRAAYRYLSALAPGESRSGVLPAMRDARPLAEFTNAVARDLRARLVESGLYEKEARAMVNTWRTSYFGSEGVRVLFVLPQAWTDRFIPLQMSPPPRKIVRVMVGRLEMLTPERERRAEQAVRDLASADGATRQRAFDTLRDQGRYVEPILRRVLRTTGDRNVQTLCRRLLLTDFVTELRAATHGAANGARVTDKPVHVRAQLASLLREIGLDDEAKAEAEGVRAELERMEAPAFNSHLARHYLRAQARASEGAGDDAGAARWYGRFVRFAGQTRQCGGCHETEGPRDMAWFRDWWAGRKFAETVARTGERDKTIAENEAALAKNPDDTAARMMLAYLYAAAKQEQKAAGMWAALEAPDREKKRLADQAAAK